MSAVLKLNPETEKLSRKPPLGEKVARPRLVWENPNLSAGTHKEKPKVKPDASYGRVLYNYSRTYDPSTGRYLEADPIGQAGGLNVYSYVFNNPVRYSDHYGLFAPAIPAPVAPPVGGGNGAGTGGIDWSAPFWPKWIRELFFNEDGNEPTDPPIDPPSDDPQQCEDDEDRCRKVKNECIAKCSEFGLPSKYGDGVSFRRCIRNCMERQGCFNF